jgi:hypothetical protein
MKNLLKPLFFLIAFASLINAQVNEKDFNNKYKNGDIVFQISTSGQAKAIQLATNSQYSHCGIIFFENNVCYVYEAVQPVRKIKFSNWIKNGDRQHFVVKRLKKEQLLSKEKIAEMKTMADNLLNKDYDALFEWGDDKFYCSELVWKLYNKNTEIELGKFKPLNEFNLKSKTVQAAVKKRFHGKIPNTKIISPEAILNSEELMEVY